MINKIEALFNEKIMKSNKPLLVGIDISALEKNVQIVKERIGNRGLCAVLKGDAYGHGIECVSRVLSKYCSHFAVVDNIEATLIRKQNKDIPIIRIRIASRYEIEYALKENLNIREMACSYEKILEINELGRAYGKKIDLHLSLDFAMLGRNGIYVDDLNSVLSMFLDIGEKKFIQLKSIACHLPDANNFNIHQPYNDKTFVAANLFMNFATESLDFFSAKKLPIPEFSIFSSTSSCALSNFLNFDNERFIFFDRIGNSLFGINKNNNYTEHRSYQVMHAVTTVTDIVHRPFGYPIGYERSYRVKNKKGEEIGLLGVGWLSLSRYLQGIGKSSFPGTLISFDGEIFELVGRQSMNISTIKATSKQKIKLHKGQLLFITTDYFNSHDCPSIPTIARTMGNIQPEFVTHSIGNSPSSERFILSKF